MYVLNPSHITGFDNDTNKVYNWFNYCSRIVGSNNTVIFCIFFLFYFTRFEPVPLKNKGLSSNSSDRDRNFKHVGDKTFWASSRYFHYFCVLVGFFFIVEENLTYSITL